MTLDPKTPLRLSHILFVFLVIGLLVWFMSMSSSSYSIAKHVYDYNEGWTVSHGQEVLHDMTLPVNLDIPTGTEYTITKDQIGPEEAGLILRIRASMMNLSVRIDSQEIYSSIITDHQGWYHDPYASVWHFVHIPKKSIGQSLQISFSSPVKEFSGYVNTISFGRGEALLIDSFRERIVDFVISFFLIIVGFIFIFVMPMMRKIKADARVLYLGEFAIVIGLWLMSETRILQMFTGNRFIIGSMGYICVAFIPIPLLLYIRGMVHQRLKKTYSVLAIISASQLILMLTLQVTGIMVFMQTTKVSLALLLIDALIIMGSLTYEIRVYRNKAARRFLHSFIILFSFAALEIILFFLQLFDFQSSFISIGIMVFYLLLAGDSITYINDLIKKKNESVFYRRLAYRDSLTGGFNRTAFDRDLNAYMENEEITGFRLTLFDLNDLKVINDTYGHITGDKAIIAVYESLMDSFGRHGSCYRISGDEFAVLLKNTHSGLYEETYRKFKQELVEKTEEFLSERLDVAAGTGIYHATSEISFDEFYHQVDQRMYEHKRAIKEDTFDLDY